MQEIPDIAADADVDRFSRLLHRLREEASRTDVEGHLTFQYLLEIVDGNTEQSAQTKVGGANNRGHAFLCIFLCLPFLQPIPLPGLSTPIGAMMSLLGFFQILLQAPVVPKRLQRIHLHAVSILKICSLLERLLARVEKFVKPRQIAWCRMPSVQRTNGLLVCVLGALLALPLPIPFTNHFPAIAIFLISLGTLEDDFVVISCGWFMSLVAVAYFSVLGFMPWLAGNAYKSWL